MKFRRLHFPPIKQTLNSAHPGITMWLRTLFCTALFCVIAIQPSHANPPVESCVGCEIPGETPVTYITGRHAVIYAGRLFDTAQCKTYFLYCAVNDGGTGGHDISHTNFGDFDCTNTC